MKRLVGFVMILTVFATSFFNAYALEYDDAKYVLAFADTSSISSMGTPGTYSTGAGTTTGTDGVGTTGAGAGAGTMNTGVTGAGDMGTTGTGATGAGDMGTTGTGATGAGNTGTGATGVGGYGTYDISAYPGTNSGTNAGAYPTTGTNAGTESGGNYNSYQGGYNNNSGMSNGGYNTSSMKDSINLYENIMPGRSGSSNENDGQIKVSKDMYIVQDGSDLWLVMGNIKAKLDILIYTDPTHSRANESNANNNNTNMTNTNNTNDTANMNADLNNKNSLAIPMFENNR